MISCNKRVWLEFINSLCQIKSFQKFLQTLNQNFGEWIQIPKCLIAIATQVKDRKKQAQIIDGIANALAQSMKNCHRELNLLNPP